MSDFLIIHKLDEIEKRLSSLKEDIFYSAKTKELEIKEEIRKIRYLADVVDQLHTNLISKS